MKYADFMPIKENVSAAEKERLYNCADIDMQYAKVSEARRLAKTSGYKSEALETFMNVLFYETLAGCLIVAAYYAGILVGIVGS